jgi:hypothetical protein
MNIGKVSPTRTLASKDHRGYWRGVTVIGSLPLSDRYYKDMLKLMSWPNISKSMIYNIMIEFYMKLQFARGLNIMASSLIRSIPD